MRFRGECEANDFHRCELFHVPRQGLELNSTLEHFSNLGVGEAATSFFVNAG
jgi:hypothetical protein